MVKVLLYDQTGTEYDVSYIQEIPIAITKAIADVKNPANRNSDFSKTINFPGTSEVERFFSFIWRLNNTLATFDPRLKCRIKYYVNDRIQLNGDIQLLKVNLDPLSNEKIYECSATGTLGNLFLSIGDAYLTDLDFSAYNHTLSKTNVKNSWVPATSVTGVIGSGYYYGLINYGQNQVNSEVEYHVKHMRPQLYKREYWAKIFAAAGKTWTSTYLDSTYYKSQVIPASSENILLASGDVDNSQFYARRSSDQTGTANNCPYTTAWKLTAGNETKDVVLFNEDNVAPYSDAGSQYATGTGVFTVGATNIYNLLTTIKFDLTIANTVGTATNCNVSFGSAYVYIQKWNGTNWTTIITGLNSVGFSGAYASLVLSGQVDLTIPANTLTAGEQYRVVVFPFNWTFDLYTAGAVLVTTGTTTLTPTAKTNSTYAAQLVSQVITEGYTVTVNQCIPTEIKQIDWIMTEVKAADLYILQDPLDEDNYIIEPSGEGFYTGADDWTEILDFKRKIEFFPMSDLDAKRYEFTYKSDADEFNQTYNKSYQQNFGFGFIDCVSDFVRPTKKTELIYAATPIAGNTINGLILPKIYKNDSGVLKPFKSVIRSLYNGGVINLSYGTWTLKSASGDETLTSYPFVGDCDNPYAPTLTLNWETPKAVYYSYILATYTDNNLKNRFYSEKINQLSDKRSTIVKAWFNLDEMSIKKFSFRKIIYVGHPLNSWFYVNSIDSYNVMKRESTLVTLLKLQRYDAFVPATTELPEEIVSESSRIVNGNYSNGLNNTNHGSSSHIVGGSGNFISPGATDIQLRNCTNVVVNGDVTGFIGDGLSNVVIDSSLSNTHNVTNLPPILITADTVLNSTYNNRLLAVDATAGNVTLSWDCLTMAGCIVNIIRIDGTGSLINITDINAGSNTYRGAALPQDLGMAQYDPKILTSYSTTIYRLSN